MTERVTIFGTMVMLATVCGDEGGSRAEVRELLEPSEAYDLAEHLVAMAGNALTEHEAARREDPTSCLGPGYCSRCNLARRVVSKVRRPSLKR